MLEYQWPKKTREIHSNHFDSTNWNDVVFRDDDIIIATYAKSGTTWIQQIISQLLFQGEEGLPVAEMSPWVDLRVPPKPVMIPMVEGMAHRRFLKTHLPVDALVYSPKAKYVYIGRDGRDVVWSLYNHHANANEQWYEALNETPGLVGPPIGKPGDDVHQYFLEWLEKDGYPFWSFWENTRTWWAIRDLPNLKVLHFQNLKDDMEGEMRSLAEFLDIPIDESKWPAIVEHCTFDYMKKNATASTPLGGIFWEGGAKTFINRGVNGRWSDVLTEADNERYEKMALEKLGEDCANWLLTGKLAHKA